MTLIITVANDENIIQVSDRRLSYSKGKPNDESNKAIVMYCNDARMVIGYTGLAEAGKFKTRDWLLDALNKCGPPDFTANGIINRFREMASQDFANLKLLRNVSPYNRRLTILFSGYLFQSPVVAVFTIVTNFENRMSGEISRGDWGKFVTFNRREEWPRAKPFSLFNSIGVIPDINDSDFRKLDDLVNKIKNPEAIIGKLIDIFHKFAGSAKSEGAVGKQLNSVVLSRDLSLNVRTQYYSNEVKSETYMPDVVYVQTGQHLNVSSVSIRPLDANVSSALSGPKLKRNQICWCGSGKKYKRCHGE